jgi:hypothetical protein
VPRGDRERPPDLLSAKNIRQATDCHLCAPGLIPSVHQDLWEQVFVLVRLEWKVLWTQQQAYS